MRIHQQTQNSALLTVLKQIWLVWGHANGSLSCRFQCILEYVEKPLSKFTADTGAVLAKAPCARHILRMNLDPPEQPATFPQQAEILTAAKSNPHQQCRHELRARKQQKGDANEGLGDPECKAADLTGPQHSMQDLTAAIICLSSSWQSNQGSVAVDLCAPPN